MVPLPSTRQQKKPGIPGVFPPLPCLRLLPLACAALCATLAFAQPPAATAPADASALIPAEDDLTHLTLEGSSLSPARPFLVQRDETPDYTREFLRVEWRKGDPIDLYVIRPTRIARPPVTLFLYGFPSETDRFRNDAFCKSVTQRGYAAVGLVSALTGHRFHGRGLNEWFVGDLRLALVTTVHDVEMVLNYLDTRPDLDSSRAGMLGQGSGATIAILAASVEPRLKRIDLMDPWGDWPEWMAGSALILDDERAALMRPKFLASVAGLDPVTILPGLDPQRVHLRDVLYDRDTPSAAKRAIEAACPKGAQIDRYATPADFEARAARDSRLLDWLQANPQPDPKHAAGSAPVSPQNELFSAGTENAKPASGTAPKSNLP